MRQGKLLAALASLLLMTGAAWAEPDESELEAGFSRSNLDNGFADWRSVYIDGKTSLSGGQVLYGSLREVNRFSFDDQEVLAGYYFPLSERWTGLLEANVSPSHAVLPKWSALGEIIHKFNDGWVGHLGLRQTEYNSSSSTREILTVERYWDSYRAAYTFSTSQVSGGGRPSGSLFSFSYYYGDTSNIGLGYGRGEEVESIGQDTLLTSDVRSLTLVGRHWFNPAWALSYEVGIHEQGLSYTREGLRLGLRHRF